VSRTADRQISFADLELTLQGMRMEPLLQAISDFLDDQEEMIDQVRRDLERGLKNPETGRGGLTPQQVNARTRSPREECGLQGRPALSGRHRGTHLRAVPRLAISLQSCARGEAAPQYFMAPTWFVRRQFGEIATKITSCLLEGPDIEVLTRRGWSILQFVGFYSTAVSLVWHAPMFPEEAPLFL
jgi:hypothetical protein